MGTFEKFCAVCYMMGFFSLMCAGYVYAFGIPNFENLEDARIFCNENGGYGVEPHRQNYNTFLCMFEYNGTMVDYSPRRIENKDWAEHFDKEVGDYCFTCWSSRDCASEHNEILRERGVHC